jgi:hypothetical protein
VNHAEALAPSEAFNVMSDTCLITPETFDSFLMALLRWYEEESYEGVIPNLYEIFDFHEYYTEGFFEIFAESLAWRTTYTPNKPRPDSFHFTDEQKNEYCQLLRDNYNILQPSMVYDFERTMRSLNFVYRWDSTGSNGKDCFIKNQVVCEVW